MPTQTTERKQNAAGYMLGDRFVPIRSGVRAVKTKGGAVRYRKDKTPYNEFLAGDFDRPSRKLKVETMSLSQFVRSAGGIRPDVTGDKGDELRPLTRKQSGTTGLVNTKGGRRTLNLEGMAEHAREVGFMTPADPDEFLQVLVADATGRRKTMHPAYYEEQAEREYLARRNPVAMRNRAPVAIGGIRRRAEVATRKGRETKEQRAARAAHERERRQARKAEAGAAKREREREARQAAAHSTAEKKAERERTAKHRAAVKKAEALNRQFKKAEQGWRKSGKPSEAEVGRLAEAAERAFDEAERMKNPKKAGAKKGATKKPNGLFGSLARRAGARAVRGVKRRSSLRKASRAYRRELALEARLERAQQTRLDAERDAMRAGRKALKRRNPRSVSKSRTLNVSPVIARQLLKNNVGNRPVDPKKVESIAAVMSRGIWKSKTGITFTNGLLTDGQHRLLAIIKSKAVVPLKVTEKTLKAPAKKATRKANGVGASFVGGAAAGIAGALVQPLAEKLARKLKEYRAAEKNPRAATAKRNSAKRPANVSRLYSTFKGTPNTGSVGSYYVPANAPSDGAHLGDRPALIFENGSKLDFARASVVRLPNGGKVTLPRNPAVLVGTGGAKSQRLHVGLSAPYRMPNGGPREIFLGYVKRFLYTSPKPHLYKHQNPIDFYHDAGEVDGRRPGAYLVNGTIELRGGGVSIRREGIVN